MKEKTILKKLKMLGIDYQDFDNYQLLEIKKALIFNKQNIKTNRFIDIRLVARSSFDYKQMALIRNILMSYPDIDISILLKSNFNYDQMYQVLLGIIENLNVSLYAREEYNFYQMFEIRSGLIEKIDVSGYLNSRLNHLQMHEIRMALWFNKHMPSNYQISIQQMTKSNQNYLEMKKFREKSKSEIIERYLKQYPAKRKLLERARLI